MEDYDEDYDEDADDEGYNPFEVFRFGHEPQLTNGFDRHVKLGEVTECRNALATLATQQEAQQAMADLLQNAPGGGFDVAQFVVDVEAACAAREQWVHATDALLTSILLPSRPAKSASMGKSSQC